MLDILVDILVLLFKLFDGSTYETELWFVLLMDAEFVVIIYKPAFRLLLIWVVLSILTDSNWFVLLDDGVDWTIDDICGIKLLLDDTFDIFNEVIYGTDICWLVLLLFNEILGWLIDTGWLVLLFDGEFV